MDQPQPAFKRRQFLVDRGYQLKFITKVLFLLLAIAGITCITASALLWRNMYSAHQDVSPTLITTALIAISLTLLVELVIAVPVVFYFGIRHTHRGVGPINRIKRTLQAIGEGDFTQRLVLREGDVLEDLAKAINEMAERLQKLPR